MTLDCIATGSNGNCYILKDTNGRAVILDCGIRFQDITHHKAFPNFFNIDFVFVSHSHSDHNKSLNDFKRTGCEIVSHETLQQKVQHWNIGNWELTTFPVPHNVPNWGVILKSKLTNEKFCYVTDFTAIPKIEGIDYWLYEINYIDGYIDKIIDENKDLKHFGFNNHNSLEKAIDYFSELKTRPKKIFCCHSSGNHSINSVTYKKMKGFADEVFVL